LPFQGGSAEPGRPLDQQRIAAIRSIRPIRVTRRCSGGGPDALRSDIAALRLLVAGALVFAAARPGWAISLSFVVVGTQQYAPRLSPTTASTEPVRRSVNDFVSAGVPDLPPLGVCFSGAARRHLEHHWRPGEDDDPDRESLPARGKGSGRVPPFPLRSEQFRRSFACRSPAERRGRSPGG
jgi:hypothetical protein